MRTQDDRTTTKCWDFVNTLSTDDEVSRFGQDYLLNVYMGLYFAIRSENFMLRNSCVKEIAPVFFAYSRDK